MIKKNKSIRNQLNILSNAFYNPHLKRPKSVKLTKQCEFSTFLKT